MTGKWAKNLPIRNIAGDMYRVSPTKMVALALNLFAYLSLSLILNLEIPSLADHIILSGAFQVCPVGGDSQAH